MAAPPGGVPASPAPTHSAVARRTRRRDTWWAFGFLAPQLVGLAVFVLGPMVFAFYLSFTNWDGFNELSIAGLDNYRFVFTDPQLRASARNTLWLTVLQVPGLLLSGLAVAYLLQRAGRVTGFYRLLFFAPQVTSSVAVAAIWLYLFNPQISPVNSFLSSIGITAPNWLQDPRTVIPALVIVGVWQGLGYQVVIFVAGLSNVPRSLIEAASIDGANEWQKFWRVTIPMLSPTILFLSITSIIASFQVFDIVYVMFDTNAASPARTIVYEIVQIAFQQNSFGRASALAVNLFVCLLLLTGLQLLAQRRWVYYAE
ncbi:multiple sugar transport system permease protein [Jiangella alkaliphila]|uniref:Multiple sugar transport system permease protein n=1 Tax=Jiangella alkaliphila TaxID=419479 RepID=A0A1H2LDR0_9ACTN|nr:multiple sugar transport system permease protein [Jiangella alkaliphila]